MLYSCLLQVLDVFKTSALLGLLRADQYIQTILFGGREAVGKADTRIQGKWDFVNFISLRNQMKYER